jgi:DNA polymerase III epsilon subunit-like protein
MPMRKSSPTVNILTLNPNCFFGIEAAKEKGPAVDHFSLGIQGFKSEEVASKLEKRGLKLAGVAKEGLKFVDPDGMLVQLNAPDYPGYVPGK